MAKSALYVANISTQTVAVDGVINPGTIIRRFGPNINLSGNAIQISGPGYYEVNISVTAAPTEAGEVTITLFKDGVAIQGATATETGAAAGDLVNLSISTMIREFCSCCDGLSNLTLVLTGVNSNVTNVATTVEKL